MAEPRIVLLAMTGFGNPVLRALDAAGLRPALLVTRAEGGPYPYYPERKLADEAAAIGIPVEHGAEGERRLAAEGADLLLIATYRRRLRADQLRRVAMSANVHPSLLPAYRGASPIYWALRNGELETGVTVHLVDEELDAGPIVWQRALAIRPEDTQGTLRRRLADLAALAAVESARALLDGIATPRPQEHARATAAPRIGEEQRWLDLAEHPAQIERHVRALTPWPGALVSWRGETWRVLPDGAGETLEIGPLRLRLARESPSADGREATAGLRR